MASEHDKEEYNKNALWNDFNVENENKKVCDK